VILALEAAKKMDWYLERKRKMRKIRKSFTRRCKNVSLVMQLQGGADHQAMTSLKMTKEIRKQRSSQLKRA
jgi:hypothetical protein